MARDDPKKENSPTPRTKPGEDQALRAHKPGILIKAPETTAPYAEESLDLAVEVQTPEQPEGVPLHELLRAMQEEVSSVTGLVAQKNRVFLKYRAQPTAEDRERLQKLLRDPKRLQALLQREKPTSSAMRREDLEKFLLDDATPDAEWLRAFRRYAVAHLIKPKRAPK